MMHFLPLNNRRRVERFFSFLWKSFKVLFFLISLIKIIYINRNNNNNYYLFVQLLLIIDKVTKPLSIDLGKNHTECKK